jgi:glycosyltransferase involved in cell wall biosynthesis
MKATAGGRHAPRRFQANFDCSKLLLLLFFVAMKSERELYSIHLSTAKSWRGGENQIFLLARGLLARGQKALVIAPRGAPLLERCAEAGIPARGGGPRGEFDPLATLRLIGILRRERPGILHLHDGHAALHGQLAGRLLPRGKMKVVAHRRTVFPLKGRWKYTGRVDRIVAISGAVQECLLKAGVPEPLTRVVYSGMDFPKRLAGGSVEARAFLERCGIPPGSFVIAHAAALTAEKRQQDLIQALRIVNEKVKGQGGRKVHLCIAGAGDREEFLRAEAARRALGECVHFAGFMRDLRPLWAVSGMAVFASEAEGLCTALVEAQGAGLPAVVTRAGGMVEVVADGQTGLLVEVGDAAGMAESILKLYADAALRQNMGGEALRRAAKMFSSQAMVDGISGVYRELWALA